METWDPHLKETGPSVRTGGRIAGIAFCIEGDRPYYLPFAHEGGGNLDEQQVLRYMAENVRRFSGTLVGTNLSYDLDWLWSYGLRSPDAKYADIMVASALIDEHRRSHSLDALSRLYLGETKVKDKLHEAANTFYPGQKPGNVIGLLPSQYVGAYAEGDVTLPLSILSEQLQEIRAQDLTKVWELESRCLPALVAMRQRGVRIDQEHLERMERRCETEIANLADRMTRLTGYRIRPGDAMKRDILVEAFKRIDIPVTGSLDKEWLVDNAPKHPAIECLRLMRRWNTLKNLSVESVKKHLVNGRIHCVYNQVRDGERGARYGRLSCSNPNMQQQPARGSEGAVDWRKVYIPESGEEWASLDYSQQEPRLLVHFAELAKCEAAAAIATAYRQDPDMDFHDQMAKMARILRNPAKIIFLGLCYGMGEEKLKRQLALAGGDVSPGEIFRNFHTGAPFVSQLAELAGKVGKTRGYIKTLSGRRCRSYEGMSPHKNLNRLIQGSAADQTKEALASAYEANLPVNLQIHDELTISVSRRETAEQLREMMLDCVMLQVPSKVDIKYGKSWGHAE